MLVDERNSDRKDDRDDETAPIVGLWSVTIAQGNTVFVRGFDIFHSDHTEVLNEFDDPHTGNTCLGVWKHVGPLTYN